MTIEVKVPVLPESVEDATIATWRKQPGDSIRRDENLVDLETDKVVLEVPAPVDGVVKELRSEEGDTVHSDDVIAVIEEFFWRGFLYRWLVGKEFSSVDLGKLHIPLLLAVGCFALRLLLRPRRPRAPRRLRPRASSRGNPARREAGRG